MEHHDTQQATDSIVIPPGADIRLFTIPLYYLVIVAPPPLKAGVDLFFRPSLSGLFTHEFGLDWPDRRGAAAASAYLAGGHPICLQFEELNAATACHKRLMREAVH